MECAFNCGFLWVSFFGRCEGFCFCFLFVLFFNKGQRYVLYYVSWFISSLWRSAIAKRIAKAELCPCSFQQTVSNSAIPESTTSGGRFKLDILKNKAKKSLTSSLENIFSRVSLATHCQRLSQISLTVKTYQIFFVLWPQSDKYIMKWYPYCEIWGLQLGWLWLNCARKFMVRPHIQRGKKATFWIMNVHCRWLVSWLNIIRCVASE